MGYIRHVFIKLWRPINFKPIIYLIVSIHHTVHLINLNMNNYVARLANDRFKIYGPPKFFMDMSHITNIYVNFAYHSTPSIQ